IETALDEGKIDSQSTIIEPTSGNTGIALAAVCATMGLKLVLTMPESMSVERRKLLVALGAKLELTEAAKGMNGAIEKARQLQEATPNSYIINQFSNPANPRAHSKTTALEILRQVPDVGIFAAGVGTAGTITGVGGVLRQKLPECKLCAIEPYNSPVLTGGKGGPHKIQGIGAGFVPKNYNEQFIDKIIQIRDEDAISEAKALIAQKGLMVGISSGANVLAAKQLAKEYPDKKIVTILCDSAMRYMSTDLFG
ncbi:MAG: PLP-dependent cysteine synthase family protein, partial [Campylobacterota bacterium]